MANSHHSDWDFNETQYTGVFHPKNKMVNVKVSNIENFSKYAPPPPSFFFFDFGYNFF